jgi:hypothetical protein
MTDDVSVVTDLTVGRWLVVDVDTAPGSLARVDVGSVAEIREPSSFHLLD